MASEAPPPSFLNADFNKQLQMSTSAMSDWFENSDIASLLNQEVVMDFPTDDLPSSPTDVNPFYTHSPEVFTSDSSAYASDSSETHSPFDQFSTDAIHSGMYHNSPIDDTLFEPYNLSDPLLVPEIEKILASNPYQMEADTITIVSEVTSTPSKKRPREAEAKSPVTLSRDQLLTMTSKEIEDYVNELKTKRNLSAAEEKELKRQRRLVKNREYASQSRSRKKQFVDDLETQLATAKAEADEFKKQNQVLAEENKILRRQLGSIAETIKKVQQNGASALSASTSSTKPTPANLSASSGSVGVFDKFVKVGAGRSPTANGRSVSACLLAIFFMVFTFAAFWDNDSKFGSKDNLTFGQRSLNSLPDEVVNDPSLWEAASSLLRESWISSSLPSWESAFTLFASSYPSLFSPNTPSPSLSSSSPSSSPSSFSSSSSDSIPLPKKQIDKIIAFKASSYTPSSPPSVPHPPPSSLPSTNNDSPCNATS